MLNLIVASSCSPTVQHVEHVCPLGPELVQTAAETPGWPEQICLLLHFRPLLSVWHETRQQHCVNRPREELHLWLSASPAGNAGGRGSTLGYRLPPRYVRVCQLWRGAAQRHSAVCLAVAHSCVLVSKDDVGMAQGQTKLPQKAATQSCWWLWTTDFFWRLCVLQWERRQLGRKLLGARTGRAEVMSEFWPMISVYFDFSYTCQLPNLCHFWPVMKDLSCVTHSLLTLI